MPAGQISQGMGDYLFEYIQNERARNRQIEDADLERRSKTLQAISERPDFNPNDYGQYLHDMLELSAAGGGRGKQKKGTAGLMGSHELPLSQLLTGIQQASAGQGTRPLEGPTTESVPPPTMPQVEQSTIPQRGPIGPMPGMTQPRFDGQSVLNEPIMIPPEPIQAPPEAQNMLSAGRDLQKYGEMSQNWAKAGGAGPHQLPPERQPYFRSPQEMAQQEGQAAGVKAGAVDKAKRVSEREAFTELGATPEEYKKAALAKLTGRMGSAVNKTSLENAIVDGLPQAVWVNPADQSIEDQYGNPIYGDVVLQNKGKAGAAGGSDYSTPRIIKDAGGRNFVVWPTKLPPHPEVPGGNIQTMPTGITSGIPAPPGSATNKNAQGFSGPQQFTALNRLQDRWNKETKAYSTMINQFNLMQEGVKQAEGGNLNSGSQAILVTFQKILDPNSVVRESEYARSPEGLGLINRMQGAWDRLRMGGAGVPITELRGFAKTAQAFISGLQRSTDVVKKQVQDGAKLAGLDPSMVFGTGTGLPPTTGEPSSNDPAMQELMKFLTTPPKR